MARAKQFESLIGTSESNLRFRAHYYIWDTLHGYLLFSRLNSTINDLYSPIIKNSLLIFQSFYPQADIQRVSI